MNEERMHAGPNPIVCRPRYENSVPPMTPEAFQGTPLAPYQDLRLWQRYLADAGISMNERPPLHNPIAETLKKKKDREKPSTPWRWMRSIWVRDWYNRRQEKLVQDANESRSGSFMFMTMSQLAIRMAVNTEPNRDIRETKRRMLLKKWRKFGRELFAVARS